MSVQVLRKQKAFVIRSKNLMYALEVEPTGYLICVYYGKAIERLEDLPWGELNFERKGSLITDLNMYRREYPTNCDFMYDEAAFTAHYADGVRECVLKYEDYEQIDDNHFNIMLADQRNLLRVTLHYETFEDVNVINKHVTVENRGTDTIILRKIMTGCVYLPDFEEYRLTSLPGKWAHEYDITRQPLKRGKYVLETRTGYCNSQMAPYFALDQNADEHNGKVWFGTLQWCGNHKIVVERTEWGNIIVTAGLNDYDFSWPLKGRESFQTPVLTVGYTEEGFGGAGRTLHSYQRKYVSPKEYTNQVLPVIYNAWAAFELDIDAPKLMALAEKAAEIGTELFVVDDGWYGAGENNSCDFGDWFAHPTKFPEGLSPLIRRVNELGMKFGLWIEPEMVAKTSKLYKAHPDWLIGYESFEQKPLIGNRLVLNLAKEEVLEHLKNVLYELLSKNNIEYLKWDSNRFISQPGWENLPVEERQGLWYCYFLNLYRLFEFIHEHFPNVLIENCASGGLRAELGLAKYCSRINRSDNQDPRDVMFLHDGFTYMHRPRHAGGASHITKDPYGINERSTPLAYKARAGMMGSLAASIDLRQISLEDKEEIAYYIKQFKSIRHITQLGELYKLVTPQNGKYCAWQYVSLDKNESVVFVFGLNISFREEFPRLKLRGLNEERIYRIEVLPDAKGKKMPIYKDMSGQGLLESGIRIELKGDYDNLLIKVSDNREI